MSKTATGKTAADLELPPARERLLRSIAEAGTAGLKVYRRKTKPQSPAMAPFHARQLVVIGYAQNIGKTRSVTDETGTYDVTDHVFTDAGGTSDYQLMSITQTGLVALALRDEAKGELADRHARLSVSSYRRSPGGETCIRFDRHGRFRLELYPAPLVSLGKDFAIAVELGLVDAIPIVCEEGRVLVWHLTTEGMALRRKALGLPEPLNDNYTIADADRGRGVYMDSLKRHTSHGEYAGEGRIGGADNTRREQKSYAAWLRSGGGAVDHDPNTLAIIAEDPLSKAIIEGDARRKAHTLGLDVSESGTLHVAGQHTERVSASEVPGTRVSRRGTTPGRGRHEEDADDNDEGS